MNIPKRTIYILYYLKTQDWKKFNKFMRYVSKKNNISKHKIWKEILISSYKYNISLIEYFFYQFYFINKDSKKEFAGMGYLYELMLEMNPRDSRDILEDKSIFLKKYQPFIRHKYMILNDERQESKIHNILNNDSGKIVLKSSKGQCGIGIEVRNTNDFNKYTLIKRLMETGNDIVEDFIQQHNRLNELSPSGLNTIRIITQLDKNDEVNILGCRLRITINSSVDNLAAGNIAAPINEQTGIVEGPGVYSDITKKDEFKHPITEVKIVGFQIPFWESSLQMVKDAALLHPQNRSIGWDVAITNDGPELLEGNHNWCKLLWQLPVKKGLKHKMEKYLL